MKLTIDRDNKTIKLEGLVNLDELTKVLDEMFPEGTWLEYSLDFRCEKGCCTKSKGNFDINDWVRKINDTGDINKNPYKPMEVWYGTGTSTGGNIKTPKENHYKGPVTITTQ